MRLSAIRQGGEISARITRLVRRPEVGSIPCLSDRMRAFRGERDGVSDTYPSPGLLRTYLGQIANPSARFIRLLDDFEEVLEGRQARALVLKGASGETVELLSERDARFEEIVGCCEVCSEAFLKRLPWSRYCQRNGGACKRIARRRRRNAGRAAK